MKYSGRVPCRDSVSSGDDRSPMRFLRASHSTGQSSAIVRIIEMGILATCSQFRHEGRTDDDAIAERRNINEWINGPTPCFGFDSAIWCGIDCYSDQTDSPMTK